VLDFKLKEYGNESKMVIADRHDRRRSIKLGVRHLIRKSRLSQKAVYAIIHGQPVRRHTLSTFSQAVEKIKV